MVTEGTTVPDGPVLSTRAEGIAITAGRIAIRDAMAIMAAHTIKMRGK